MPVEQASISTETATQLVRDYISRNLTVTDIRLINQGVFHQVCEFTTNGEPRSLIAKMSPQPEDMSLRTELATLAWYKKRTAFPVPEPYACVFGSPAYRGTCLLMQKVHGRTLQQSRLSPVGRKKVQIELAQHLADLHDNTRDAYGSAIEPGRYERWLDRFGPNFELTFNTIKDQLSPRSRAIIASLIDQIDKWLPESGRPTLIHGDLWGENIILDDRSPDHPSIVAFIDGGAYFYDVEFELAHLKLFETVDDTFFRNYERRHPLRKGFERRCPVYWLYTMMLHLHHFGPNFLPRCERLTQQIEAML